MTRKLAMLATLAVAAAPSAALAHKKSGKHNAKHARTKVMRAKLAPVAADVAAYTDMRGKAHFVGNKNRSKISIQLKGMIPGAVYPWAITAGSCDATPLSGWSFRTLRARPSGNANAKGRAKQFKRQPGVKYFVVVYAPGTTDPLLCGQLKGKPKKSKKGKHHTSGKGGKKG